MVKEPSESLWSRSKRDMSCPGSWGTRRTMAPGTGFAFFKAKPEREHLASAAWTTMFTCWPEEISRVRPETVAPVACTEATLFFFNDTATTEIYTLSLHDALPI